MEEVGEAGVEVLVSAYEVGLGFEGEVGGDFEEELEREGCQGGDGGQGDAEFLVWTGGEHGYCEARLMREGVSLCVKSWQVA